MPKIKIATFNVEWMILVFGGRWKDWNPPDIPDSFPGGKVGGVKHGAISDIRGLCQRIAGVIKDVDADIIGIQEGPPLKEQMELFVHEFLEDEYVVHHSNESAQAVTSLVRSKLASKVSAWQPNLPDLQKPWSSIPFYPWGLIGAEDRKSHRLARHPLLLSFRPNANKELRIVVLHTKSKFSKLKKASQWLSRDRVAILDALTARAKLSAEVFRIREFLQRQMEVDPLGRSIVVMGDLNDGPYAELMEREFMIHNVVDQLVGSLLQPEFYFQHAMTPDTLAKASTSRFPDPLEGGRIVEELIDHILVSPAIWRGEGDFRLKEDSCRVEAKVYEKYYEESPTRKRELRPSDHKPVSAVIEF